MNILFITQLFPEEKEGCYTSSALREFVEMWGKSGHNVQVIRPHFSYEKDAFPQQSDFFINPNVEVKFIRPYRIPILKMSYYPRKKTIKIIKQKPDVIICHLYNSYFAFSWLSKKLNTPLIIGIHMSDIGISNNILHKWMQKKSFQHAIGFACRSAAIHKLFIRKFPKLTQKAFIANSGIPSEFINNAHEINIKHKIPLKNRFISVCSLIKLKHLNYVLIALSKLPKTYNWEYTIIGDGPERLRLEKLAHMLKIDNNVNFLGQVSRKNVMHVLNDHGTFILPSFPETLGLAYLEAMACGNIVIGTYGWGIDGIVKHEKNGFLIRPNEINQLHHLINKLVSLSDIERARLIEQSLNTIKNHSNSAMADSYLNNAITLLSTQNNSTSNY